MTLLQKGRGHEHGGVQDELRGGDHRLAGAARVPIAGGARVLEIGIQEGATFVRVGRGIFGNR